MGQNAAKIGFAFPPPISAHGPVPPNSVTCSRQASIGPAPRAAMQHPSESRIWIGNCSRDSAERSPKLARAAYLARACTCVCVVSFIIFSISCYLLFVLLTCFLLSIVMRCCSRASHHKQCDGDNRHHQ